MMPRRWLLRGAAIRAADALRAVASLLDPPARLLHRAEAEGRVQLVRLPREPLRPDEVTVDPELHRLDDETRRPPRRPFLRPAAEATLDRPLPTVAAVTAAQQVLDDPERFILTGGPVDYLPTGMHDALEQHMRAELERLAQQTLDRARRGL